jgi:hypothetical protein
MSDQAAIVQVIDGFSGMPVTAMPVQFELKCAPQAASGGSEWQHALCSPVMKGAGFYVLPGLNRTMDYRVTISCKGFFDNEAALCPIPSERPLVDDILVCELEPSPIYSYPAGTTLIRGQVIGPHQRDKKISPIAGVTVDACYIDRLGKSRHSYTHSYHKGAYHGRFALVPPAEGTIELTFTKAGYATVIRDPVETTRGNTAIVNVEMQLAAQ